jgi:hypothetical protein
MDARTAQSGQAGRPHRKVLKLPTRLRGQLALASGRFRHGHVHGAVLPACIESNGLEGAAARAVCPCVKMVPQRGIEHA